MHGKAMQPHFEGTYPATESLPSGFTSAEGHTAFTLHLLGCLTMFCGAVHFARL
jgi:hypothetical protein